MVRTLNPAEVYSKAQEFSGTCGISTLGMLKAIYSIKDGLEGEALHNRAFATQRQYIKTRRIKKYTHKNGSRYDVNKSQEYKLISDMISFIDKDIRTRSSPKNLVRRRTRSVEDRVANAAPDKNYDETSDCLADTFGHKNTAEFIAVTDKMRKRRDTPYFEYLYHLMKKAYMRDREDLDFLDYNTRAKVRMVDSHAVRSFSIIIAGGYEKSLKTKDIITDDCKFVVDDAAKEVIKQIVLKNVKDLSGHIQTERRKAGLRKVLKKIKPFYSSFRSEDDIIGETMDLDFA